MFAHNKIFAILIQLIFIALGTLPSEAQEGQAIMDSLEAKVIVLRNQQEQIPIKNLGQKTFRVYTFGLGQDNIFQSTLEKYVPFQTSSSTDVLKQSEEIVKASSSDLQNIIGINLEELKKQEGTEEWRKLWREQRHLSTSILVLFTEDLRETSFPDELNWFQQVVLVRGLGRHLQSLAAQLIFGGVGAKARLDRDWPPFVQGSGEDTAGALRLRYSPPAWLGLSKSYLQDSIEQIARAAIAAKAFPGMQVLVAKDGHVVFHQAYGHHTYERSQKVQERDLYDLASVSKITTALPALMKLHGENRFDLDAPLKKYCPEFKKSNKADLDFRSILAHQARLKPWIPFWKNTLRKNGQFKWRTFKEKTSRRFPVRVSKGWYLHRKYRKKIYKAIRQSPLNETPGYRYSGLAFYLFPELLERMMGLPFEEYLQQTFYRPLGAHSLGFNPWKRIPLEQIIPTERDTFFRKELLHGFVHDEGAAMMGGISANAGLFGNANDLAKLLQMYLNKGSYGGQSFIAASSLDTFTHCHYCQQGNRRGLGFDKPLIVYHPQRSSTARSASAASYGHSGYTGTFVWVDPEEQLIYIFLSNRVHPSRERRQIYQLNVRPRIHQLIYDSFLRQAQ
ncbi:MAG: serine hydrolase domain-containing protein [Bacteroidota bacterium]